MQPPINNALVRINFVLLAGTLVLLDPQFGYAAQTSDVRVVNTAGQAVPTTIQGTVPTTVQNAVSISGTVPTTVQNPVSIAGTVPVRDVDNAARSAIQYMGSADIPIGQFGGGYSFEVPAGKRLVIEHVSVFGSTEPPDKLLLVAITTSVIGNQNGIPMGHFFGPQDRGQLNPGNPQHVWLASELTRLYADAGTVFVNCQRNNDTVTANFSARISGYLVDIP